IQNPGLKPNWALVIGSTYEGMGKDLMLEPVRVALGASNVREITPEDLDSTYTWFLAKCRLVLVEEMKLSERKATMNRLKPLVAAPPYTLSVNAKFEPQYEIPNIIAAIFFTNVENALAISSQGRRYFVTWNDGQPRDATYYEGLVAWYRGGGAALAARWLLQLDVSDFKAQGRAPDSGAKDDMRRASRTLLEEWLEDSIADVAAPFDTDIVALEDVLARMPDHVTGRSRPTGQRLSATLKRLGAVYLGRVRLGKALPNMASDRAALWAIRRAGEVSHLSAPTIRDRYLSQLAAVEKQVEDLFT
ncbi:MAG TPA: primase-helicase family protein, partial [Nannocystis sp.]